MHIYSPSSYISFCEYFYCGRKNEKMNIKPILTTKTELAFGGNGYKIIEVNVTDPTQNSFAVITPVKMK